MKIVVVKADLAPVAAALSRIADALERLVAVQGTGLISRYTDIKDDNSYARWATDDDALAAEDREWQAHRP